MVRILAPIIFSIFASLGWFPCVEPVRDSGTPLPLCWLRDSVLSSSLTWIPSSLYLSSNTLCWAVDSLPPYMDTLSCSDTLMPGPLPWGAIPRVLGSDRAGLLGWIPCAVQMYSSSLGSYTCWLAPCGDIFLLDLGSNSLFLATRCPHPGLTLMGHHLAQLYLMAFGLYCSLHHGGIWN